MKKTILSILLFASLSAFAQSKPKQDSVTIVQVTLPIEDYIEFEKLIDKLVDSKAETNKIFSILSKGLKVIKQPADKPKQPK